MLYNKAKINILYIYKVKCLTEVYMNYTSEFDRGHRPLK